MCHCFAPLFPRNYAEKLPSYLVGQEMGAVLRRPADLDEDLRLMAQEVRDYVDAVLNSLSANVPKVSFSHGSDEHAILSASLSRDSGVILYIVLGIILFRGVDFLRCLLQFICF